MNASFGYKCGESRLVILWVSGPACRGDNTRRRKELQSAPDFCPSLVVIMRNHSYFLIWVGWHADSLPVWEVRPTYGYLRVQVLGCEGISGAMLHLSYTSSL